jgi:hypothetical protein
VQGSSRSSALRRELNSHEGARAHRALPDHQRRESLRAGTPGRARNGAVRWRRAPPIPSRGRVTTKTKDMDGASRRRAAPGSQMGHARRRRHVQRIFHHRTKTQWPQPESRRSFPPSRQPRRKFLVSRSSTAMILGSRAPRPNPSLEARPNGPRPSPRRALVHDAPRGLGLAPSVPPQLQR